MDTALSIIPPPTALVPSSLLDIKTVSVFYDGFRAVDQVDLTVAPGEVVAIIGMHASGKSSLLKAIAGQVANVTGTIAFDGVDLGPLSTIARTAAGIALVPEGRRLFPSLTVEENLTMGWDMGRRGDIRHEDIYQLFPALRRHLKEAAGALSGGQQQMVALGRALLANPRLLLCDEMSLGLSRAVIDDLYRVLATMRARGMAVVVVDPDVDRALAVADRFYCLCQGRVTLSGATHDVDRDFVIEHYFDSKAISL